MPLCIKTIKNLMISPCHLQPSWHDYPLSSCLALEPRVLITAAVGLFLQPDEFSSNFLRKSKKFSKKTTGVLWRYSTKALARPATKMLYAFSASSCTTQTCASNGNTNMRMTNCSNAAERQAIYKVIKKNKASGSDGLSNTPKGCRVFREGLEINLLPFRRTKVYP